MKGAGEGTVGGKPRSSVGAGGIAPPFEALKGGGTPPLSPSLALPLPLVLAISNVSTVNQRRLTPRHH